MLRVYIKKIVVTRPFFDVKPSSRDEEFVRIAPQKPVFELLPRQ